MPSLGREPISRRRILSTSVLGACGVLAAPYVAACSPSTTNGEDSSDTVGKRPALDVLIAAADKEGTLNLATVMPPAILQKVQSEFNKRWGTNIEIKLVSGVAADIVVRITQEVAAGRHTIDAALGNTSLMFGADPKIFDRDFDYVGVFEQAMPEIRPVVERLPKEIQGLGLEGQHLARAAVYNTKLVSEADVPHSWQDLLGDRWSGQKLGLDPSGASTLGFSATAAMGYDAALQYSLDLAKQRPVWATSQAAWPGLARGEFELYIGPLQAEFNYLYKSPDAPFAVAPMEYSIVTQQVNYVAAGASHINAARLYIAWEAAVGDAYLSTIGMTRERTYTDSGSDLAKALSDKGIKPIILTSKADLDTADRLRAAVSKAYAEQGAK